MKKWKEALSKLEASTANAVNSAVRQIDKTLANDGPILPQQQPERSPDPQQYLRCVHVPPSSLANPSASLVPDALDRNSHSTSHLFSFLQAAG
jgi:hypothetical protein